MADQKMKVKILANTRSQPTTFIAAATARIGTQIAMVHRWVVAYPRTSQAVRKASVSVIAWTPAAMSNAQRTTKKNATTRRPSIAGSPTFQRSACLIGREGSLGGSGPVRTATPTLAASYNARYTTRRPSGYRCCYGVEAIHGPAGWGPEAGPPKAA